MIIRSKIERITCREIGNLSKTYSFRRLLTGSVLFLGMLGIVIQPEVSKAAAKKPALSQKKLKMGVGKKTKLTVKNKKGFVVSWRSNKKAIATVSKAGKIQAKKQGTARITAVMEPSKGGKSYRLSCQVSVRKLTGKNSASGKMESNSTPAIQEGSNRSEEAVQMSKQSGTEQSGNAVQMPNPSGTGQSGEAGQMPNQSGTGQSGVAGQMPNQPGTDPSVSEPTQPGGALIPEDPADSATGGAVISGEAKLLFGNYNDNIPDGNFLGNQRIDSYEQLQTLMNQIQDQMNVIEGKMADEKVFEYYRFGYETLLGYFDQLGTIEQDYFEDHVLYVNTMNVSRGFEYTLASVEVDIEEKTLHLNVERTYHVKEGQCVTCDMPYYSYFFQIPRGLSQGCEKTVIRLMDTENRVPSDDPDLPVYVDEERIYD